MMMRMMMMMMSKGRSSTRRLEVGMLKVVSKV